MGPPTPPLVSAARPLRVAVVGAGPAGLYAAEALPNSHPAILFVGWYNGHPD